MTVAVLLLSVSYAAIAALLLNLNLSVQRSAALRVAAILLVTCLYAGAYYGYRAMTGWATPEPLPEKFRVQWLLVEDPDKVSGAPGAIYFWVRELDDAGFPAGPPRAHRIPWSEASAEAAQQALAQLDEGELLNGRMTRDAVENEPDDAYAGEISDGAGGETPGFEFSRVPPPSLPPKSVRGLD